MNEKEILAALRDPKVAMSSEAIREAWAILRQRMTNNQAMEVLKFKKGDIVEFDAKGMVWRGLVTKINQKSVVVDAKNPLGRTVNYKVAPSLLRPAAH